MTMNAKDLAFVQGRTASTLRSQRPRLVADAKLYHSQTQPPTNVDVPHVSGTGTVGHTLHCTMGNWNGEPVAYGAQWLRSGTPVLGATFDDYLLTKADSGHMVACEVTAYTGGGEKAVESVPVAVTG